MKYNLLFDCLNPACYTYKDSLKIGMQEKKYFGVMAQDILLGLEKEGLDVKEYSIITEKNGYLAVDYIQLIPILISKIKELEIELKKLKGI